MRSYLLFRPYLMALAVAFAASGLAATAEAGSGHDRIYADSFGNLVIYSRAGYKRIVVGAGHMAKQLSSYEQAGDDNDDDVVYLEDDDGDVVTDCYRPPVFLKGRDYMYGLSEGRMPDLWNGCH